MMTRKLITGILAMTGMLFLILDSQTALAGGLAGVQICVMQVIPALLPFFVLSILISSAFTGTDIPILRPLGRLCRIPRGSESLLLLGLLGGYPTGAQGVCHAYRQGQLSREDTNRLLGFCSNAGPSFLFGIVSTVFPYRWIPWALWAIHISGALIAGILLPGGSHATVRLPAKKSATFIEALEQAIRIMAKVCGWIILFRVLQSFLERWLLWMFSLEIRVGIIGLLELANGCLELATVSDLGLRILLCSTFLSLGGLCVTMQTLSVTGSVGLGMYIPGKLLQSTVCILLTLILQWFFLYDSQITPHTPLLITIFVVFLAIFTIVLHKYEKNSSIPALVGV